MTTPPRPDPPTNVATGKPGQDSTSAWISKHKVGVGAGVLGALLGLFVLYERSKSGTSSTTSASSTPAATTTLPATYAGSGGGGNTAAALESQLNTIQNQLATITAGSTSSGTSTTSTPGGSSAPASIGETLGQAIAGIQSAGGSVSGVTLEGVAGQRNSLAITPAQYGAYAQYPVSVVNPGSGNSWGLFVNGPSQ